MTILVKRDLTAKRNEMAFSENTSTLKTVKMFWVSRPELPKESKKMRGRKREDEMWR